MSAAVFFKKPDPAPVMVAARAEMAGPTTFLMVTFDALFASHAALKFVSTVVLVAPAVEVAAPRVPALTVGNCETKASVPADAGNVTVPETPAASVVTPILNVPVMVVVPTTDPMLMLVVVEPDPLAPMLTVRVAEADIDPLKMFTAPVVLVNAVPFAMFTEPVVSAPAMLMEAVARVVSPR